MTEEISGFPAGKKRSPARTLESRTLKDGAIYLYRRADYKKPTWFIRLRVPGVKEYIWRSSKATDEHAAYKVAEDLYNQTLGKVYAGVKLNAKRISVGIDAFIAEHQGRKLTGSIEHTITLANRVKPSLQTKTFDELDTPLVVKMLDTISKHSKKGELSPNTIKRTDLLPVMPPFMGRVCSGYAPQQGGLQTRLV